MSGATVADTLGAAESDRLLAALPAGTYAADVPWFMVGGWEQHAVQAGTILRCSAQR
ncbi:MAG: hypothetical protein NVS3B26_07150 [Mycobacteriales bacterium]